MKDKVEKLCFFEETFLVVIITMQMILEINFLIFDKSKAKFVD